MKLLLTWLIALIIGFYAGRRTPPTTPAPTPSSDKEAPPAKSESVTSSASPDAAAPVKTDDPLQLEAELLRLIGQLRAGGNTNPIRRALVKLARLDLPRAVSLHTGSELFTYAQLDAAGSGAGATAPRINITFIRPFHFGVP